MKLYLVRHGLTLSNKKGLLYYDDEELSIDGIEDLYYKKYLYNNINFDYVYCSTLKRAKMTVSILFPNIKVNEYRNDIIEFDWIGKKCDLSKHDLKMKAKETLKKRNTIDIEDSETYEEFITRITLFLEELKKQDHDNVLIVSHGIAISMMMKVLFNIPLDIFDLVCMNGLGYIVDLSNKTYQRIGD